MCGIVGSLELGGGRPEEATIQRMVDAVSHRGPDGSRVDVAAPVALGHARLRVIDLSTQADQPMWNEDRTVAVVLNGEIYNFRELREELLHEGYDFRTRSDTEVILRLYEHCGEAAIDRLDGMFALGIWDAHRGQLLLARDRAGKKPLFFCRTNDRIAFASEIKALLAHPDIGRKPNLEDLPLYLTYGYFPAPRTSYKGIRQLPPATIMRTNLHGDLSFRYYWTPPTETNGIHRKREVAAELRDLLNKAVAKRLISDVPLGAFLSGGVDSTIVVGLMSRLLDRPVRTFSIGFEGHPDYDETRYAEEVAKVFQTEHTVFRVRPPEAELLEKLVHHHDGPFGDSSAIPTYIVSRLARQHVTVVLNGDGGDELFAGYPRFVAAAMAERIPFFMRSCGATIGRLLPEPSNWASPMRRVKRALEAGTLPLNERFQNWCSFFPDAARELLLRPHPEEIEEAVAAHFRSFLSEAAEATPLSRLLYLNFCTYLPEDLLVKMDRTTMAHGLEARSPFLDTALVEFAAKLPDKYKLRGFSTKYVLRKTFEDLIPPAILHRSKMGFGVPLGSWFRGPLRSFLMEHLDKKDSRLYSHIRREAVASLLDRHMADKRDFGQQLFCLLTLEIWMRSL